MWFCQEFYILFNAYFTSNDYSIIKAGIKNFNTCFKHFKKTMFLKRLKLRHIFCENKSSRKISLRSSKSPYRTFLMAIIKNEAGLFSLRLGHGAALTCHWHVIHFRAAASLPLKLPRCAVIFTQQHSFLQCKN